MTEQDFFNEIMTLFPQLERHSCLNIIPQDVMQDERTTSPAYTNQPNLINVYSHSV